MIVADSAQDAPPRGFLGLSPVSLTALVFYLQPIAYGAFLPRLPEIRGRLDIGPAELSLALLGAPVGILMTLPFSGVLVARIGARKTIFLGFLAFLAVVAGPAFAPTVPLLFLALVLVGVTMSLLELGLNVMADRVESGSGRLIMTMCHGCWSLGLMTGSAIGAGMAALALPAGPAVLVLALLLLPLSLRVAAALPGEERAAEPAAHHPVFFRPTGALLLVCAFVFGITLTEGAAADWAAIFMRDVYGWGPGPAALAFSGFAAMVAAGRFMGDASRRRLGAVRTARLAGALSLLGVVLLVGLPVPAAAMLGFACLGLGLSVGFPLAVTAAAGLGDRPAAANVAFLSMVALSGFLVGPPMIGGVAELFGMRAGFAMVLPGLVLSLVCTFALGRRPAPAPSPSQPG